MSQDCIILVIEPIDYLELKCYEYLELCTSNSKSITGFQKENYGTTFKIVDVSCNISTGHYLVSILPTSGQTVEQWRKKYSGMKYRIDFTARVEYPPGFIPGTSETHNSRVDDIISFTIYQETLDKHFSEL